eukprot:2926521-Rhodomonas_salina.1
MSLIYLKLAPSTRVTVAPSRLRLQYVSRLRLHGCAFTVAPSIRSAKHPLTRYKQSSAASSAAMGQPERRNDGLWHCSAIGAKPPTSTQRNISLIVPEVRSATSSITAASWEGQLSFGKSNRPAGCSPSAS